MKPHDVKFASIRCWSDLDVMTVYSFSGYASEEELAREAVATRPHTTVRHAQESEATGKASHFLHKSCGFLVGAVSTDLCELLAKELQH